MKKFIAGALAIVTATIFTAGCAKNVKNFSATYFDKGAAVNGVAAVDETLYYDVYSYASEDARGNSDKFPKIGVINHNLSFSVDETRSSYVTTIKTSDSGDSYKFTSTLTVVGKYVYGENKEYAVEKDVTVTEVEFRGIDSSFKPISVKRTAVNVVPLRSSPSSENDFVKIDYSYTVDYGKTAKINVTANDETSKKYLKKQTEKTVEIKKYAKKDFVENDILFTVFRNFDYAVNFTHSFNVVDAISGSLTSVSAGVLADAKAKSAVKLVKMQDTMLYGEAANAFNAVGVKFSTTGTYGRAFAYCYYANSVNSGDTVSEETDAKNKTRRVPILIAKPSIFNTGYIVFALKSAR